MKILLFILLSYATTVVGLAQTQICFIADYNVKDICENSSLKYLSKILKGRKINIQFKLTTNSNQQAYSKKNCNFLKKDIEVFGDKNICCRKASENRINNFISQNTSSEKILFYESTNGNLIDYQTLKVKCIPYYDNSDLKSKLESFLKLNKKKSTTIIIHDAVATYDCSPSISFESEKIVCAENQKVEIIPLVNVQGGNCHWSNGSFGNRLSINPTKNISYSVRYEVNGCFSEEAKIDIITSDCSEKPKIKFDLKDKVMYDYSDGFYYIHPPNENTQKDFISKRFTSDPNSYLILDSLCTASTVKIDFYDLNNNLVKTDLQNLSDLSKSKDIPKMENKIVLIIPNTFFNEAETLIKNSLRYSDKYKIRLTSFDNKNKEIQKSEYYFVRFIKCPYYAE
jgi:hypothetical protein